MAANMNILRVFFRFLLVVFLCTTSAPVRTAVAQNANTLDEIACSPAFTANEYTDPTDGDLYPQPEDPVEVFFGNDSSPKVIQGRVVPDMDVSIAGSDKGTLLWTIQSRSDSNGYYRVSLGQKDCETGNTITVWNRMVLQVAVGAQTYSMVAHHFIGVVDPINNTVSGTLTAGQVADIRLEDPLPATECADQQTRTILGTATAQPYNRFKAELADFGGRALMMMRIHDGDGSTILSRKSEPITLNRNTGYFYGTMEQGATVQFTYTLTRAGLIIETTSKLSSNTISHKFSQPLQPGDVIEVSRPGQLLYHAVVSPLTASIDLENDQITGQAEPGQSVFIQLTSNNNSSQRFTHCFDNEDPNRPWEHLLCAQAGGDGAFAVQAALDIRQGDIANITLYDAQGNAQTRMVDTGSLIHFDQMSGRIDTYFPTDKPVTLKALDSQNTVLWQQNRSPGNNYLYWSLPYDLFPHTVHSIEISDGTTTKTMTVPEISVDPLYGQTNVSGSAPDGKVLVEHLDEDYYQEKYTCTEGDVIGGKFSVNVDSQPISGIDEFWIIHSDGQGNFFTTARSSRYLMADINSSGSGVVGSVEQPGQNVSLTVLRGASVVNSDTFVRPDGTFMSAITDGGVLQVGDRVVVTTQEGDSFELEIPELEGRVDSGQRKLIAFAPDSARVLAGVSHRYKDTWVTSKFVQLIPTTDGYFEADFPPLLNWDCPVSPVDGCFQITVLGYTHDGNLIFWRGPAPSNVTADAFEPDDTRETAQEYEGSSQHRTILASGEEDWLRFDVAPEEVGRVFTISVSNMSWKMALDFEFSSSDGVRQRTSGTFTNEANQQVQVKPDRPGTYFLKLKAAASEAFYGSCDSAYDLTIHRPSPQWIIHLPLMIQN